VLADTNPLVWRRLLVPETYSFWDLHVAIQDAMGWTDCHLHEFVVVDAKTLRGKRIGIPDEEFAGERPTLAGWKVPIARHLTHGSQPVRYLYDFGDDWNHTLEVEDILPADGGSYPRCVAGAGACPPEDVGGTHGYAEFLHAIRDLRHPERAAMLTWAGGRFDPLAFDPMQVHFDDPRVRWAYAFAPPVAATAQRTRIPEGHLIAIAFTERERTLIGEHTFADPDLTTALANAEQRGTSVIAPFTLDDLDELRGHVAATASHCKDRKLRRELDALFARLTTEMDRYDDGQ